MDFFFFSFFGGGPPCFPLRPGRYPKSAGSTVSYFWMYFQIHHLAIKAFRPKYSIQGGTRCSVLPSQQLLLSYYLQMANPPHFLTTKILLLFPTLASWQYKRKHIHRKCQKMLQNLGRRLLPGYMISCS